MVIDIRSCDMLHVMACDMSSNDTCWQVSDMGGETLDAGALMCLFAQALVRFRLELR